MKTELRFVDDDGKMFWLTVDGDIIALNIENRPELITVRLDTGLARRFRREMSSAIGIALMNRYEP